MSRKTTSSGRHLAQVSELEQAASEQESGTSPFLIERRSSSYLLLSDPPVLPACSRPTSLGSCVGP